MIKGAIFDFDGTLFDSMPIWDTIAFDYLRSIGKEPHEDLTSKFAAMSMEQAALYYQTEYGVQLTTKEIIAGVNHMVEQYYRNVTQPKKNTAALLELFQAHDVKICITTATDETLVTAALQRCHLDHYFSAVYSCSAVGKGKDHPDIFRQALKHLGTLKEQTLVFEDALYAVKTAKNDSFLVAGVYDKSEKEEESVKKISDYYLTSDTCLNEFWKQISA